MTNDHPLHSRVLVRGYDVAYATVSGLFLTAQDGILENFDDSANVFALIAEGEKLNGAFPWQLSTADILEEEEEEEEEGEGGQEDDEGQEDDDNDDEP